MLYMFLKRASYIPVKTPLGLNEMLQYAAIKRTSTASVLVYSCVWISFSWCLIQNVDKTLSFLVLETKTIFHNLPDFRISTYEAANDVSASLCENKRFGISGLTNSMFYLNLISGPQVSAMSFKPLNKNYSSVTNKSVSNSS